MEKRKLVSVDSVADDAAGGGGSRAAARFAIATEALLSCPAPLTPPSNAAVRVKKRSSFSNGTWRVDLTRVAGKDDDRTTGEVEIELEDKRLFFSKTFECIVAEGLAIAGDIARIAETTTLG
jgi:hypothetical protein